MMRLICKSISSQKGVALIVLVIAFIMATSVLVITNYTIDRGYIKLDKKTSLSLAKAKEALLSYAISYYERNNYGLYGFLPCPELAGSIGKEGNEMGNCGPRHEHSIGRLPWKTLNINPLNDGSGECLWYAVSGVYKNGSANIASMHNEDSVGMFLIKDQNNNLLKGVSPEERVVAVVISAGSTLAGQNRPTTVPADPDLYCRVTDSDANNNITEYLESVAADNNAIFDDPLLVDTFISVSGRQNTNINDRIISITQEEIFSAIKKSTRFNARMNVLTEAVAGCVKEYTLNNDAESGGGNNLWLPWPSPIDFSSQASPQNDYRIDDNYIGSTANVSPLGRLPYNIDNSNVLTGNTATNLFANCTNIDATINGVSGVDLSTGANEYRKLWKHWKDHLFYAIGSGFEPSNATASATPDCSVDPALCLKVYDTATAMTNYYAAVVIYSGSKTSAQLRQSEPPESAAVPVTDSKGDWNNYIESYYAAPNYQFEFSSASDSDDIAYCISSANPMVVSKCSP